MDFPIDLSGYSPLKFDLNQEKLADEELQNLKDNISLVRDCLVFFTALANVKGLGGHTGGAFDIVPEHTITDSEHKRRWRREAHKIELRNRKDSPVTVYVDEKFPSRVNWRIDETTARYQKRDARTARFEIKIAADSTETIRYTATQTW